MDYPGNIPRKSTDIRDQICCPPNARISLVTVVTRTSLLAVDARASLVAVLMKTFLLAADARTL